MPGYACARFGGKGACPEDTHAPKSIEGRALAALGGQLAHQRRIGPGGYAGIDLQACLSLTDAQGIPTRIAALLLPHWEAGLIEAANRRHEEEAQ